MENLYSEYYKRQANLFNEIRLDKGVEIFNTLEILFRYIKQRDRITLDIGCGTGRYLLPLSTLGYTVYGLDISIDQLKNTNNPAPLICASSDRLPLKDSFFDYCMMILIIHQISAESLPLSLIEAFRVLKKEGFLFIKTCSHEDLRRRPFGELFPSSVSVNIQRYLDVTKLYEILHSIGFEIIEVVPMFSEEPISVKELIFSFKNKHNTTLALIPQEEFDLGCERLEKLYFNVDVVNVPHYHTMIIAKK